LRLHEDLPRNYPGEDPITEITEEEITDPD